MDRDFGAGLSVDELIGMTAWLIIHSGMPKGKVFRTAIKAAQIMVDAGMAFHFLVELWEDGHSVWVDPETKQPVVIRPTGQLIRSH